MSRNSFGQQFRITTWGESHGPAVGVVIDGCPAGLAIDEKLVNEALAKRAPGNSPYTSPRKEPDVAQILSGVFEGKTTGTPISILIPNQDADPSKYEATKHLLKPGHAQFAYLKKYGVFDYRGGGRASARETACRVAAGSIAKALLAHFGVTTAAYLETVGSIKANTNQLTTSDIQSALENAPLPCPDESACQLMMAALDAAKAAGDSLGGCVRFIAEGLPAGWGEPIYEKIEAKLAQAMMSIPASKGFEMGTGFAAASMLGSEHNDHFITEKTTDTNHAGGVLAGISTGMPVTGRVAFKPASSIAKPQNTVTTTGEPATFQLPEGSRHDPCVAIRAVPVVDAMCALVLADMALLNRSAQL